MQLKQFYNLATKDSSRKKVLLFLVIYLTGKLDGYLKKAKKLTEQALILLFLVGSSTPRATLSKSCTCENNNV